MLRAVVLTQYRRVTDRRTDGHTDGIAIACPLAMRALRRAVKTQYWVSVMLGIDELIASIPFSAVSVGRKPSKHIKR